MIKFPYQNPPLPNIEDEWILRAIGSNGAGHLIDFTDTIVTKAE